jgi:hypothetical protein
MKAKKTKADHQAQVHAHKIRWFSQRSGREAGLCEMWTLKGKLISDLRQPLLQLNGQTDSPTGRDCILSFQGMMKR